MSLWTPGGEVPVNPNPAQPAPVASGDEGMAGLMGMPDLDELNPQERAQVEAMVAQMAEAQRQIASTPGEALVANHLVGLYELAAIKLSIEPPALSDARLAIDAMAAIVDAVGDRLGPDADQLRDGLQQIQVLYVQRADEA